MNKESLINGLKEIQNMTNITNITETAHLMNESATKKLINKTLHILEHFANVTIV